MTSVEMRIPLSGPDIHETDISAVNEVLRSGRLSLGPKLAEFERAVANYVGAAHGVAVSSGTTGLHVCVRALGLHDGDEVIVPSFSFVAVANALRYERALPVFVDIDPVTLNIDPSLIERAITPRTRAILMVHTFGCPADIPAILEIAKRHRLSVIEDACEAIGAEYDDRRVGVTGDAGVFAFYPNKQITTGEGGVIVTNNPRIAAFARTVRNQGRGDSDDWFQHTELGYNYRISEINCALGLAQLNRIESILHRREEIARTYNQKLSTLAPGLTLPILQASRRKLSWFVYVVRLPDELNQFHRDWIIKELQSRGIGAGRYFAPIHLQPIYQREACRNPGLPVTEWNAARTIALPFFNKITGDQIEEVSQTLGDLVRQIDGLSSESK
jgi:perosamine synthetase